MLEYILAASLFGIVGGLKPGPLGIIIIHESLTKGFPAGVRASFAPLITDAPIILFSFYLLRYFKDFDYFIAIITLLGGLNILWISYKMLQNNNNPFKASHNTNERISSGSLWKAVRINFLSPNPYLFWFTVGGAYLAGTFHQSIAFIFFSLFFLISAKILVAYLAVYFSTFLSSKGYIKFIKILALIMCFFGLSLLYKSYSIISNSFIF